MDGATIGPLIDDKAVVAPRSSSPTPSTGAPGSRPAANAVDGPGFFYEPTVLSGIVPGTRLLREEIFGPVLGVTTFDTEDEAVPPRTTPSTAWSATSTPATSPAAHRLIDRLETGMMGLNTGLVSNAAAPFGGVKASGLGREGGSRASRSTSRRSTP